MYKKRLRVVGIKRENVGEASHMGRRVSPYQVCLCPPAGARWSLDAS